MPPPEPTLFYDANCTLCTMWKESVAASGWRVLRFEDANNAAKARELGVGDTDQLQRRMCLLKPDGTQSWGYDAIVDLLRLGEGTRAIAALLALGPVSRVGRWLYDKLAINRSCAIG